MSISQWFRTRPAAEPDDLLGPLLDAFQRQDYDRAMVLINSNSDRIRSEFASWTAVPEPIRQDTAELSRYVNTLVIIAKLFEKAGDASLRAWLEGGRKG